MGETVEDKPLECKENSQSGADGSIVADWEQRHMEGKSSPQEEVTPASSSKPAKADAPVVATGHVQQNVSASAKCGGWARFGIFCVKFVVLLFLSVFTIVFAASFGITVYRSYLSVPDSIEVPLIEGKDLKVANELLRDCGLRLRLEEGRHSTKFPERIIITQNPPAGKSARKEREVLAVVSLGPETVKVPSLKGKSMREVEMQLSNNKLTLGKVTKVPKDRNRPNEVLSQNPQPGVSVKPGTAVNLELNDGFGVAMVAVPDWHNKSISNAQALLDKVGLRMGRITWSSSSDIPQGRIISQSPPQGAQVLAGSEVQFEVSAGAAGSNMFVERHLELALPAGSDTYNVKIIRASGAGEDVIYQSRHVVGDTLDMWVSGPAHADLEVYINEKLFTREKL